MVTDYERPDTLDRTISLLSSRFRRWTLQLLMRDDVVEIDDLVRRIAALEDAGDEADGSTRERVAIALYHAHLPKLADSGVIDYDSRSGFVRLTETATALRPALDAAGREEAGTAVE